MYCMRTLQIYSNGPYHVGTRQRSDKKSLTAGTLARSGRLRKVLTATWCLGKGPRR